MRHRKTENMLSLMGGALLGAAAMYLMDPEEGKRRRKYIAEHAGDYVGSAGEALQSGWDRVSDSARTIGQGAAGKAEEYGQKLSEMAQEYGQRLADHARGIGSNAADQADDIRHRGSKLFGRYFRKARNQASDYTGNVTDQITDYSNRLWDQVRGLGNKVRGHADHAVHSARETIGEHTTPVLPITLTAVGCCAIGGGLMFLMDPQRGRSRRAWLIDKTTSFVRGTGQSFYKTGQHLANRAYGGVEELRGQYMSGGPTSSEQLLQRVRSEMGHMVSHPRLIQVMADANGSVTLSGQILVSEADRLVSRIESLPGVNLVINRLEVKTSEQDLGAGNSASQRVPQI